MGIRYIILAAVGLMYENRSTLGRALFVPFVLYLLLDVARSLEPGIPLLYAIAAVSIAVQAVFAITTHRVLLLGRRSVPKWGLNRWSRRETVFVVHLLGLVLVVLPINVLIFIPGVGGILTVLLYCWVVGRLSLVFPAIAIDQKVSFRYSWQLTARHQLLMFFVVAIYPLLLSLPARLVGLLPESTLMVGVLSTCAMLFIIAALSVAYRVIYLQAQQS